MSNLQQFQQEIWKDILGYEGLYQASNLGRIKSLDKRVRSRYKTRLRRGKLLSCRVGNTGYVTCCLCRGTEEKNMFVHRLVLLAFKGEPPIGHDVIMHINDDKTDNRLENLKYATQSENVKTSFLKGRARALNKKAVIATNIFTGEQTVFDSVIAACKALGTQRSNVNKVLRGVRDKTLNYSFKLYNNGV